jgi:hypothetical protein
MQNSAWNACAQNGQELWLFEQADFITIDFSDGYDNFVFLLWSPD